MGSTARSRWPKYGCALSIGLIAVGWLLMLFLDALLGPQADEFRQQIICLGALLVVPGVVAGLVVFVRLVWRMDSPTS